MRPRSIAVSAATLIAAASMAPLTAQAAGNNTLYVNSGNSACTDSGSGTYNAPFCTIQTAANAANPGDLVNVAPGTYAATTITRSGTASAPITFTGNLGKSSLGSAAVVTGLNLTGASYVNVEDFRISDTGSGGLSVDGGSDVTAQHDDIIAPTSSEPQLVHVTGGASAVTIEGSVVEGEVVVDDGSTGAIITTDEFDDTYAAPVSVSVADAANTAVTSNSLNGCGASVAVIDSSSNTSIENNVVNDAPTSPGAAGCSTSPQPYGILVDQGSASGTTEDYNDVYVAGGADDYDWAGTPYATGSALYTAVGQGQHDYDSTSDVTAIERSPLINAANSAAVGEQPVDINGNPRTLDPLVTPSGAGPYDYYDRGAVQFQDPVTPVTSSFTSSASQVPVGGTFTLHGQMTDTWADAFTYEFEIAGNGTLAAGADGTASTSLSTSGAYEVYAYAVPTNGSVPREFSATQIRVVAASPLTPAISATANGPTGVNVSDNGTTGSWNVTKVVLDFGDSTPTVSIADGATFTHTYATAGTYKITETVTDADGETATTATSFTTNAFPSGTLIQFAQETAGSTGITNLSNPPAATDIAHAAIAAMPNGTDQVAAVTKAGVVQFDIRNADWSWQNWQTLSQPGVTVKSVSIAALPNGSSQLIEITSGGVLEHIVRNANGTWQNGWGVPGGSTGFTEASIAGLPNGSTQLVAVTTGGQVKHDIRFANGSWQGWNVLTQSGVTLKDASIAGMPDGSAQIVELTTGGVLRHNIRFANGSWQAAWGVPAQSSPFTQVSIAAESNGWSEIVGVTEGGLEYDARQSNGSWTGWGGFPTDQIDTVSEGAAAGSAGNMVQIVTISAG